MKNEKGFTLIEMMIVLLIISVLLIITVPNITKHNSNINKKGCEAFLHMVEGQVQAYQIDKNKLPASAADLVKENYLKQTTCPDGKEIVISSTGAVSTLPESSE
ncbi:competence type IV pilus major pilin ComGC [Mesobacillus foraminis]|uniref:competence type IV pilus major pilin ComGC n=1 Tax=Mesobacillus foraminis TaxID=279826 RepID=UPI000EF55A1F|nr:competence type IV pilus major pilin ComGC [Mesobacillus foraminis]